MSEQDPKTILKKALGAAYSDSAAGIPRVMVIEKLRDTVRATHVAPIVQDYLASLSAIVAVRTIGNRCGCHVSQIQLGLLREAVA